jgi:antitoxin YefM
VQRTRRPVVLTQHGRSAAVLIDVREYDALLERLELLEDVQTAEKQLARRRGVPATKARQAVLARLR